MENPLIISDKGLGFYLFDLKTVTIKKNGVSDGDRTHDHWSHNPVLYQLRYTHHKDNPSTPSAEQDEFSTRAYDKQ